MEENKEEEENKEDEEQKEKEGIIWRRKNGNG